MVCLFFLMTISLHAQVAPPLGDLSNFSMLSGDSISGNKIIGASGTVGSTGAINNPIQTSDPIYSFNSGSVSSAIVDLYSAINFCDSSTMNTIAGDLSNQTLTEGNYYINGTASLDGYLHLNGDSTSVFIFTVRDSLLINSHSGLNLGAVRPENVYWNIKMETIFEDSTLFYGVLLGTGDINIGDYYTGKSSINTLGRITTGNSGQANIVNVYSFQAMVNLSLAPPFNPSMNPLCDYALQSGGTLDDFGKDIKVDGNGEYYVTGEFRGSCTFTSFNGSTTTLIAPGREMFLAKYNPSGNLLWIVQSHCTTVSGVPNPAAFGKSLEIKGEFVYVTGGMGGSANFGGSTSIINSPGGLFVGKFLKNNGSVVWLQNDPGIGNDLIVDGNDNVVVIGDFDDFVTFNIGQPGAVALVSSGGSGQDVFIAKYDLNGNFLWVRQAGGTVTEVGNAITVDNSNDIYITGVFTSPNITFFPTCGTCVLTGQSAGTNEAFIAKYNSSGTLIWAELLGGNIVGILLQDIAINSSGQILVAGMSSNQTITYHQPNGTNFNIAAPGNEFCFVTRLSNTGIVLANKIVGTVASTGATTVEIIGNHLYVDNSDHVFVTGFFVGTGNFSGTSLTNNGFEDIFIVELDNSFNQVFAINYGGSSGEAGLGISGNSCKYMVTGVFTGMANFGSTTLPGYGGGDCFILNGDLNQIPTISANGNLSFCPGGNVILTSSPGCNYLWSPGGETTQAITVSNSGTFTVSTGCALNTSLPVTVNVYSNPVPVISGNNIICQGGTANLDAGSGFSNYLWSTGDQTQIINTTVAGTYTVTVTDNNGCSGSTSITIVVNPNPNPAISGATSICQGSSTILDAGSGYSGYNWSTGGQSQTINVTTAGTYIVTVTDGNGCSGSASVNVTLHPNPSPTITGVTTICPGTTTILDAGSGYLSYNWSTGATTQAISVSSAGIYTVTVTNNNGCSGTSTATITTFTAVSVSITPSPTASYCSGNGLYLYANISAPATILWNTGSSNNPLWVNSPGVYTVTATDQNGCSSTAQTTVVINPIPVVSISGSTDLCNGTTLIYNAFPIGNYTYSWSVAGGTVIGQSANQLAIDWTNLGVGLVIGGTVSVTVTDNSTGCTASQTLNIAACCVLPGSTNYQNPVFTNTSMAGTFIINGVCTIQGNVDFTGATIFMGPQARIELANGSTLTINNSHLLACSYMWNGIIADHFTETIRIRNSSIIEDATKAVIVKNNGVCDITFSRFNKNRIHIYSELAGPNCIVRNSDFDCINGTLVNCLIPPYSGQHTTKGIELVTSEFLIGQAGNGNSFLNCDIGIESNQSRTTIMGNRFDGLLKVAINAFYDGELNVRDQNQFMNCPEGIITTNRLGLVDIRNNTFANTKRCVFNYKNRGVVLNVEENTITDAGYCAIMSTWNLRSQQQFIHNIIQTSVQSISTFGIKADNCFNPIINDNVVTSDPVSIPYFWSNGIMTDMSPSSYVVCNYVGNIGRGLWFGGMMPGSTVGGNIMDDCFDQLFLNWNPDGLGNVGCPAGDCPPNGFPWDNEWLGDPYTIGGGHETYANNSNANGGTIFHTRPGAIFAPIDHFNFGNASNCQTSILTTYTNPTLFCQTLRIGREDEPRDLEIANETIDYTSSLESFKWLSKNYLYFKLKQDSVLLASNPEFENEKDSLETTNIGDFEALRDSINQLPEDSLEYMQIMELMNLANSVSPQEAIEIYLKLANQIYLNRLSVSGYNYSNSQWNSINYISELCPYEFGPAVYSTRIMKAMKDTVVTYYDACMGLNSSNYRTQTALHDSQEPLIVSMLPNPNYGEWSIDIKGAQDEFQITIEIIDAMGRVVDKITTDSSSSIDYKNGNLYPGHHIDGNFINN